MNTVGRPPKENAITKNGKSFMLWLNKNEMLFLDNESYLTGLAKAEIIRRLLQKYILDKE